MMNELSDFYIRLRPILDERGITVTMLTKELGITTGQFSDWKHGKRNPSTTYIAKIAKYLDISADYMLGLSPVPNAQRFPDNAQRLIDIFMKLGVDGQAVVLSAAVQEQRAEMK